jgi:hypothetical protein
MKRISAQQTTNNSTMTETKKKSAPKKAAAKVWTYSHCIAALLLYQILLGLSL